MSEFDNKADTPIDETDELAMRLKALDEARQAPQEAVEATEAPETVEDTEEPTEAVEVAPKVEEPETSEEDDLKERVKRAHIAAREEKRRAKLLEQELEVLRGNRTEHRDETIAREAALMAHQMVAGKTMADKTTAIRNELDAKFGGAASILTAFAESFPDVGGVPTPLVEAIIEAGDGQEAKIVHWLSNNLDEAERIYGLSPTQQGVAIHKIATKLAAPKKVSQAPVPAKPVSGSKTTEKPAKAWDKQTNAERFADYEAEELAERRRKYS